MNVAIQPNIRKDRYLLIEDKKCGFFDENQIRQASDTLRAAGTSLKARCIVETVRQYGETNATQPWSLCQRL